jgi:hypothetical protein
MSLTYQELRDLLSAAGLPAWSWQFPDLTYETVSPDWVIDNWRAWLDARPGELCVFSDAGGKRLRQRPLWIAECDDCDNLAIGTLAHAQVGNALSGQKYRLPRGGIAYGFLFYTAAPSRPENFNIEGGHAINWFVAHDRVVRFFEPGMGMAVELSEKERGSAWFGLAA